MERLMTVFEAAERLALKPATIRKWIFLRKLTTVKLMGRSIRIRQADVEALISKGTRSAIER